MHIINTVNCEFHHVKALLQELTNLQLCGLWEAACMNCSKAFLAQQDEPVCQVLSCGGLFEFVTPVLFIDSSQDALPARSVYVQCPTFSQYGA